MSYNNSTNNRENKKDFFVRIKRRVKLLYLRVLRIDDPPERIARGAAIGAFMGILPTFGLGALLAVVFSFIFRANKAASVIGSMIMNPLTTPFFWTLSILIGSALLGEDGSSMLARFKNEGMIKGAGEAYLAFLLGNAITSTAFSAAIYFLTKAAITRHRRRKALKATGTT